jgi:hypothetical protein
MVKLNWQKEIEEGRYLERDYALQKIAALMKQYDFTVSEISYLTHVAPSPEAGGREVQATRPFDPFFDAW